MVREDSPCGGRTGHEEGRQAPRREDRQILGREDRPRGGMTGPGEGGKAY